MSPAPKPGSEPASFGGPGFKPRAQSHDEELASGRVWRSCGARSEVAPLRRVLLAWPGDALGAVDDPDAMLMLERVNLAALCAQTEQLARAYEAHGVAVELFRPAKTAPPNLVFMRDLFFMAPSGAVLARMGAEQRAGEEPFALQALAGCEVPVLHAVRGRGLFEGADALWLDEATVLVGEGMRTNAAGREQVEGVLREWGVKVHAVPLPRGTQHLLGVLNFVDRDLAVVRKELIAEEARRLLAARGVRLVELEPTDEVVRGRAMNFVTLAPRKVLMPAGCPRTRQIYEREGVACVEVEVGEYLKAAGGPGCVTGILWRGD